MIPRILPDLLRDGAERFAERPAVEWTRASRRSGLTYRQLEAQAMRGAGVLRASGLMPAERALLVMDGCPEWAASFFAILQGGLVAVLAPGDTPPAALAAIARHVGARAAVVGPETAAWTTPIQGVRTIVPADLFSPGDAPLAAPPSSEEDPALFALTSGSTGRPRAVELSHRSLLAEVRALLSVRDGHPDDALLSILPPAHLFELVAGLLAPLACGARIVYAGTPLPNRLIESLRVDSITRALAVPALVDALYEEILAELATGGVIDPDLRHQVPAVTAKRLSAGLDDHERERIRSGVRERIGPSFRALGVGGAAIDPVWADVLAPFGVSLEVGYGLTEAGPIVSLGTSSECPPGSVGRPLPGVEVRVDETGEILVRSPYLMRGYVQDPEATAEALRGGWLHTGDRGRLDPQWFLYVTGRLKDVIVTAEGETLDPEDVERYYHSPLFTEMCVVPLSGPQGNDRPTLVVVPVDANATQDDLERAFARLRAAAPARYRVAGLVRFDEPLPRTALGKLRRRALADVLDSGRQGVRP